MGTFLRRNSNPKPYPNPNHNPNRIPNPIQNALVYISFCVARKKSENRALGHIHMNNVCAHEHDMA